ncbi:hypothetical protein niasHT_013943 [Heterodera trifolii]|uniref:Secretory protein n=1 Tax=Heterodera trifolii TaxID=157864 RepID=A0ABD2L1Q3_9BILA
MRTILFLAMVCMVLAVLMEMANSKAVKKDNKKGAVAASPAKGKASPKGGKSPAKGKAAKVSKKDSKLKAKKDAKGIKVKNAKPTKESKARKGAPKKAKKVQAFKTAPGKEKKSPAKPIVLKASVPSSHKTHSMIEPEAVPLPAHARSLATVPYSTPGAADRNSLPSYTSTGTNLDTADENDDYQNYYYETDSSREFDASAEEEDQLYEEEDGAMSGQMDDYGIGIGQEYGHQSVEVPPKSVMLD